MFSLQQCFCGCFDNSTRNPSQQKTRLLLITLAVLVIFLVAEWGVGLWSRSLSLQADAAHMFSDAAAVGLSLVTTWLAQKPAKGKATFGYNRVEILAALVNSLSLIFIAAFITWEAINRWQSSEQILGLPMLGIAVLGLIMNLLNIALLHPHSHNDLNLRGALLHILSDTLSSVGVIVAALAVHLWNWLWADIAVSLLVAILTGLSALPLLQESLKILLEYAPESIDPAEVEKSLKSYPGVSEVEKLHIWTISSQKVMLCANLVVECQTIEECDRLLRNLQIHLKNSFGISETSLQLSKRKSKAIIPLHPLLNQSLTAQISTMTVDSFM